MTKEEKDLFYELNREFQLNKTQELFSQLISYFPNSNEKKCRECGDHILYQNQKFRITKSNGLKIEGSSFQSKKNCR